MKKTTLKSFVLGGSLFLGISALAPKAHAVPISYTGGTFTENFNSLGTNATGNNTVPNGFEYAVGSTPVLGPSSNPPGSATYGASNGSVTTGGGVYSFGTTAAPTDRAFGSFLINANTGGTATGNPAGAFYGFAFTNASGSTLSDLTVSYNGEQYRNQNTAAQKLDFQYRVGSTVGNVTTGTWTDFDTLDFTAPVIGGTAGIVDGNAAGRTALNSNFGGLTVASGDTIFFRWVDVNDSGNDHNLGIDDFNFSATVAATATPEPATWAMMAMGVLALAVMQVRRKRSENGMTEASDLAL